MPCKALERAIPYLHDLLEEGWQRVGRKGVLKRHMATRAISPNNSGGVQARLIQIRNTDPPSTIGAPQPSIPDDGTGECKARGVSDPPGGSAQRATGGERPGAACPEPREACPTPPRDPYLRGGAPGAGARGGDNRVSITEKPIVAPSRQPPQGSPFVITRAPRSAQQPLFLFYTHMRFRVTREF